MRSVAGQRWLVCLVLLAATVLLLSQAEGRYLPTRSQDDKLLRLRQLLKDLLEGDLDTVDHSAPGGYDPRLYKREAPHYDGPLHYIH